MVSASCPPNPPQPGAAARIMSSYEDEGPLRRFGAQGGLSVAAQYFTFSAHVTPSGPAIQLGHPQSSVQLGHPPIRTG